MAQITEFRRNTLDRENIVGKIRGLKIRINYEYYHCQRQYALELWSNGINLYGENFCEKDPEYAKLNQFCSNVKDNIDVFEERRSSRSLRMMSEKEIIQDQVNALSRELRD